MDEKNKKVIGRLDDITPMDVDFAKWYTDVVKKAELIDYSSVKGCMVIRPYGYAIWENIQRILDKMFKDSGHQNVYMPMFIPETLLNKEKEHIEGFAPEVAWVTHGGDEKLTERMCVRPTSETLFCEHYANIIESYRDLPKLYNQWCSVVRWEKTTRPFLRSREFLWQEGHTVHATEQDAVSETLTMLDIYAKFCEKYLSMPVIKGKKTEKEKFAGAKSTYTIEAMMHDGKALQAGTTHYFGDGFAKAFDITYLDKENKLCHCFQTSWGVTTRLIGAIIMSHGDNKGLVLPPAVAPIQVRIIPIASHKEGVTDKANELYRALKEKFRCDIDLSDNAAGYKFAEQEIRGIPLRLEIGPRDIQQNQCVLTRRDTGEKIICGLDGVSEKIAAFLDEIGANLYASALKNREDRTYAAQNLEQLISLSNEKNGFYTAMWCGSVDCELDLKEKADVTSRCIVENDGSHGDKCVCCGGHAENLVYFGKAY